MAGANIAFEFESAAAEERFVGTYLTEAWDRFLTGDYWDHGWFWPYGQFGEYEAGPDGGFLRLVFDGDPDALVERESDRWEEMDGLTSWDLRRYDEEGYESLLEQQVDAKGEVGGEREYRLKALLSEFALAYYREFDERIPPVGEKRDENPLGLGFWAVVHDLLVQCGYDWYEETALCQRAMKNRLKSIAAYRGADAAREEYERLLAEWDAYGQELDQWLDESETGQASVP